MDATARAAAYLAAMGPALQGQGGDGHTYKAAATLIRGFALPRDEALALLRGWNATCQPPWSERELAKKIDNAVKYGKGDYGAKLAKGRGSRAHLRPSFTAEEVLDILRWEVLLGPRDPTLAPDATPDPVGDLREHKNLLYRLLWGVDLALGREPSTDRHADAILALVGSFEHRAEGDSPVDEIERVGLVRWFKKCEARVHASLNHGAERPRSADRLDALVTPEARDGCTRKGAPRIDPVIGCWNPLPEDPETIYARRERLTCLREALSPTELRVFAMFDAPLAEAADEIGTSVGAVKVLRSRIRTKNRALGLGPEAVGERFAPSMLACTASNVKEIAMPSQRDIQREARRAASAIVEDARLASLERAPRKPSGLETLARPMTVRELEDLARGYCASRYRRRITAGLGVRAASSACEEDEAHEQREAA